MLLLQAFKCDQGSWQGLEALIKELPACPDAVISNAALGSATVEQYEPDPHKQDLAMLQVSTTTPRVQHQNTCLLRHMTATNARLFCINSSVQAQGFPVSTASSCAC